MPFYALLKKTSSPDAAQRLKEFVQGLLETHEESLEATFTPQSLRIQVYPSGRDDSRFVILTVGTSGRIRTTKGWLDFLAENRPTSVLSSFLDGLASIDSRLRPLKKPDGAFSVAKSTRAASLTSIAPKLDALAEVVSTGVRASRSGSPE